MSALASCRRRPKVAKRPARALQQPPELFCSLAQRNTSQPPEWLSREQIASLLAVSERTVRRWLDTEGLPARQVGGRLVRVRRSDLRQWLAKRSGEPCPDLTEAWLPLPEIGKALGVTERTVRSWVRLRGLPARVIGDRLVRVCPSEVAAWIEAQAARGAR